MNYLLTYKVLELKTVNFIYFYFSFYFNFNFNFLFLDLGLEVSMHYTSVKSHKLQSLSQSHIL